MKKIIRIIFCIAIFFAACSQKSVPVITSRDIPTPAIAKAETSVKADIDLGKSIFISRCSKCHDLPKSEQFTAQRWEGILSSMIPRAKLNTEQGVHVKAYLIANATK